MIVKFHSVSLPVAMFYSLSHKRLTRVAAAVVLSLMWLSDFAVEGVLSLMWLREVAGVFGDALV